MKLTRGVSGNVSHDVGIGELWLGAHCDLELLPKGQRYRILEDHKTPGIPRYWSMSV